MSGEIVLCYSIDCDEYNLANIVLTYSMSRKNSSYCSLQFGIQNTFSFDVNMGKLLKGTTDFKCCDKIDIFFINAWKIVYLVLLI